MELTKAEQQVLKYLIRHTDEPLYESEIAKNIPISVGSAHQTLKSLFKKEMVTLQKKGKMNFYILNLDNPLMRQYKVTQTIAELNALISDLKSFTRRIILFGSCAEGTDTQDSDIDLAIISREKEKTLQIIRKKETSRNIQALIYNSGEFQLMEDKDKPLYERIQKGIMLWKVD